MATKHVIPPSPAMRAMLRNALFAALVVPVGAVFLVTPSTLIGSSAQAEIVEAIPITIRLFVAALVMIGTAMVVVYSLRLLRSGAVAVLTPDGISGPTFYGRVKIAWKDATVADARPNGRSVQHAHGARGIRQWFFGNQLALTTMATGLSRAEIDDILDRYKV